MKLKLRKKHYIQLSIVLICVIACTLWYSNRKNDYKNAVLYKVGRNWIYDVVIQDSTNQIIDTFTLSMNAVKPDGFIDRFNGPIRMNYTYNRGATVFENGYFAVRDNGEHITLGSPKIHPFNFTQLLPSPSTYIKINKNDWKQVSSEGYYVPATQDSYFDGRQQRDVNLAGKKIEYRTFISDTTKFLYQNKELFCYIFEAKNTNHHEDLGQFRGLYFFNEKYGIVKWIYDTPWNETTTITLKSTNF